MTDELLRDGDYARKQIFCPSRLVAWSHGSRFDLARRLVGAQRGGRLLDYGCGDGTFVAMVHGDFSEAVGLDVDPGQVAECEARLGHLPGVRFGLTREIAGGAARGPWDVITCMEVLEHCLEPERRRVLDELAVAAGRSGPSTGLRAGRVVISVPIEIGPSVAGKQLARAMAGWRGLGDYQYRERYSAREILRSVAGAAVPRIAFEGNGPDGPYRYYGHKGFDYRDVARELAERFTIAERLFSPMPWLGPVLNSQVWFVCVPR